MSPRFLTLRNRTYRDGENWRIKISIFHILSLRCQLVIYVEISSRQLDKNLEFREKIRTRNIVFMG